MNLIKISSLLTPAGDFLPPWIEVDGQPIWLRLAPGRVLTEVIDREASRMINDDPKTRQSIMGWQDLTGWRRVVLSLGRGSFKIPSCNYAGLRWAIRNHKLPHNRCGGYANVYWAEVFYGILGATNPPSAPGFLLGISAESVDGAKDFIKNRCSANPLLDRWGRPKKKAAKSFYDFVTERVGYRPAGGIERATINRPDPELIREVFGTWATATTTDLERPF